MQWAAALSAIFFVVLIVDGLSAVALFIGITEHWIIIIRYLIFLSFVPILIIMFVPLNNVFVIVFECLMALKLGCVVCRSEG